jgi:hypothetical protein
MPNKATTKGSKKPLQSNKSKGIESLLNLLINIVIPVIVLSKFSSSEYLGPAWGLVVALAFPFLYGIYEIIKDKKINSLSVIGLISILLTGGLGLLALDAKWIALKEAAVPFTILILILGSMRTKFPIINKLIYNDTILNIELIESKIKTKKQRTYLRKKLDITTYIVAVAFLVSTASNYLLAKFLLVSEPGTEAFNQELARMTALSFPVNALPATILLAVALFYYIHHLQKITELELDDVVKG